VIVLEEIFLDAEDFGDPSRPRSVVGIVLDYLETGSDSDHVWETHFFSEYAYEHLNN
jgi:hypothetical protein